MTIFLPLLRPSLPFRISTLTSLDAQFSTLVPFLPIQPHLLLRLSLFLFGSVYSFEILRPFSKLQYLSITGGEAEYDAWDWSGNSDECYYILGYFPELLEIELKHPKPISIKAFSLLLDTSPNLRKIDLTSTTWRLDPQTMISDQLSKILKGKKLETVELGILSCSAEEEVAMLRIQQELEMLDGCNLSWKGPYIEEFDNSDRYDEQSDFNSGYFGHNYGVDEDGWDSDADRRALD